MNILGYEYTVELNLNDDQLGAMGRMVGTALVIRVAKDLNIQQIQSTMLHEIIEAINFHLQLELSHQVISGLEAGIYQALVQNGVNLAPLLETKATP